MIAAIALNESAYLCTLDRKFYALKDQGLKLFLDDLYKSNVNLLGSFNLSVLLCLSMNSLNHCFLTVVFSSGSFCIGNSYQILRFYPLCIE